MEEVKVWFLDNGDIDFISGRDVIQLLKHSYSVDVLTPCQLAPILVKKEREAIRQCRVLYCIGSFGRAILLIPLTHEAQQALAKNFVAVWVG